MYEAKLGGGAHHGCSTELIGRSTALISRSTDVPRSHHGTPFLHQTHDQKAVRSIDMYRLQKKQIESLAKALIVHRERHVYCHKMTS